MYFAAACLAPLINRVLSVSCVRLLFPVKACTKPYYRLSRGNCQVQKLKKLPIVRQSVEIFDKYFRSKQGRAVDKICMILYNSIY
jgi:hypothetical protein